jgi:hypothetical protein
MLKRPCVSAAAAAAAVTCTNRPTSPAQGKFSGCTNPTAFQGTCTGTCGSEFTGSLTATCTGANTWTTNNQCQAGKLPMLLHAMHYCLYDLVLNVLKASAISLLHTWHACQQCMCN